MTRQTIRNVIYLLANVPSFGKHAENISVFMQEMLTLVTDL